MSGAVSNPQTQPQGRFTFDRQLHEQRRRHRDRATPSPAMLLGYPNRVQRDSWTPGRSIKRNFVGVFVQDDFRVNRKLSLQLGAALGPHDAARPGRQPPVELRSRRTASSTSPPPTTAARTARPSTATSRRGSGLAYTPDNGKTAVRAAFGISYFADNFGASGGTSERNYPFFLQVDLATPTTFTPFRSVSDGLAHRSRSVPLAPTLAPPAGFAVFYIPSDFHEDTAKMWNVGVQRELGWNTMVDVSYVGTRGTNIFRSFNINVPVPGPGQRSSSAGRTSRVAPEHHHHQRSATATASPGTTRCR